jgi:hypothetical protein
VLTLRGSAALLASASTIDGLTRLAAHIGFAGLPSTVDQELRSSLGVPPQAVDAVIVSGSGSLRALLLALPKATPMREVLTRLANRLAARTPQTLWLIFATEHDGDVVAVGAPSAAVKPARVAALVVSRGRIVDSDAETIRLLATAQAQDDLAAHARFIEILGRDAISRRFFKTLEHCVGRLALSASAGSPAARGEIALLYVSRLLFLGFLEAKGWLDGDPAFLIHAFDECMSTGGNFHGRVMLPLFFGTLNTPLSRRARRARRFGSVPFLNGGLFTRTAGERRVASLRFGDDVLGHFFGELLCRYRFTAREETTSFEEAAIDPEMLGRTFECLMVSHERRATGVFYTPYELVERVTSCGLEASLINRLDRTVSERLMHGESLDSGVGPAALGVLREMRVLDPACGSGAFLVHSLERLTSLIQQCGDLRPVESIRREVLATSIFGVDVNPTAVWLCQLRLWLSIVIDTHESASAIPPLPNLDRNIRVGDSLAGQDFGGATTAGGAALRGLRERYSRATGRRKAALSRMLDRDERRLLVATTQSELESVSSARRDLVAARRGRDLFGGRYVPARDELRQAAVLRERSADLRSRLRTIRTGGALPFSFAAHCADVAAVGGFTLIVGNPPWVRPHRLDLRTREALRRRFTLARSAPWASGAAAAGAGRGFASQVDLAALFVERSFNLLAPEAALSLLLPAKLWRSLAGGSLRRFVLEHARVSRIEDYSDVPATFDAAVYPGLLVAARPSLADKVAATPCTRVLVVHRARIPTAWRTPAHLLSWDGSSGAPWILLPPDVRRSFDRIRDAGVPLAASRFGRPLLGTKCGLNDAFVVAATVSKSGQARIISANGREGTIDARYLRPVARGEDIGAWCPPRADRWLIWPHGEDGDPLRTLPVSLGEWLAPYRRALMARADAKSSRRWWSLFRTDGARSDVARVIWPDIGKSPRATVLRAGDPTVPLNSCYVSRAPSLEDALALTCLLNSPLIAAWLSVVAEPARGGYRRYLGWTMSLLPVPADWETHRPALADLARRASTNDAVSRADLTDASVDAFGLRRRDVEPLLAWAEP